MSDLYSNKFICKECGKESYASSIEEIIKTDKLCLECYLDNKGVKKIEESKRKNIASVKGHSTFDTLKRVKIKKKTKSDIKRMEAIKKRKEFLDSYRKEYKKGIYK